MDSRRWHDWCSSAVPVEPPPLTLGQWKALGDGARESHIVQLEQWLYPYYFETAQFTHVARRLDSVVKRNAQTPPGAKDIAVITGPNTIGKSAFIKAWARQRYLQWTGSAERGADGQPVWYPTADIECDYCPVVFINLQEGAREKALAAQILEFYNLPSSGTTYETTRSAMKALARHRAHIVVIDDINLLKTEWRGARQVLDHLKFLNTELGEGAASLILLGANLVGGELLNDPQIKGRSKTLRVAPYDIDEPDEQCAWQRVLRDIEKRLLPHLPAGRAGMLYRDLAGELWLRTQGYFQDLKELICEATLAATRDGTHVVVLDHLDALILSDRAEARHREMGHRSGVLMGGKMSDAAMELGTARATTASTGKSPTKPGKAHRSGATAPPSRTSRRKPA